MAAGYIEALRSLQPEGPYFLAGFCFGGLLALEVAQQLTAAGQVALLGLIQSIHPAAYRFKQGISPSLQRWYRIAKRIALERENRSHAGKGYLRKRYLYSVELICARFVIAIGYLGGKGPKDLSSLPKLYIFEALGRKNGNALRRYVPRQYTGNVVLFRASKRLSGLETVEYLGWKSLFPDRLEVCEVPGHQQNLMLEPDVQRLARELNGRLKAAQQRHRANG